MITIKDIVELYAKITSHLDDISGELSLEKKEVYNQEIKVQPLTQMEINMINEANFITEKKKLFYQNLKSKEY